MMIIIIDKCCLMIIMIIGNGQKETPKKKTAGNVHKNLPNQPTNIQPYEKNLNEKKAKKLKKPMGFFSIKNFLRINQTEIPTSSTQQKIKIITTTEKH